MSHIADDDRLLAWDEIPEPIRARMGDHLPAGHAVWACPRRKRGGWFKPDSVHIEYWWIDDTGELVDAFWFV